MLTDSDRKTLKTGKTKRGQSRRRGPNAGAKRAPKSPTSGAAQRRAPATTNPRKNFERYIALARDAASSGDAIQAESYYQYADHYLRQMDLS